MPFDLKIWLRRIWHFGLSPDRYDQKDEMTIRSMRVATLGVALSTLALSANLINIFLVTRSLGVANAQYKLANVQNGRAQILLDEQFAASLPRLSLMRSSSKPNSYLVRNVGGQAAWGITWAIIQLAPNGFPYQKEVLDFKGPIPSGARVLQPSALASRDEAEIVVPASNFASLEGAQGDPGVMFIYETLDNQLVKTVFALREGGNYVVQTVAPGVQMNLNP